MENMKERYHAIQTGLANIQCHNIENLQDLKAQLQYLFDTVTNILYFQYEKIVQLESTVVTLKSELVTMDESRKATVKAVTILEKKMKLNEEKKLIGDLLNPLSLEIHNYLEILNGSPHRYDDMCVHSGYQEKSLNNQTNEEQYKLFFAKPIEPETYEKFYSFLLNKSMQLNVDFQRLLSLLREKKIRNFTQHSDIKDFFADGLFTFKYRFIDLIDKHQLKDVLTDEEFSALKTIFETYFSHFIVEAEKREKQQQ